MLLAVQCTDDLVSATHPVRMVAAVVARLDLSHFREPILAREGDPKRLATFKIFLLDEAWLFIKNETIRNYVVQAQKTWRKHNAAMILATQSIKELEESGMLAIVAESCPTKVFLANPEMNREVYREAFHLNDTELDIIGGLIPPGQMLIRKAQTSKKVQLNVDSLSH